MEPGAHGENMTCFRDAAPHGASNMPDAVLRNDSQIAQPPYDMPAQSESINQGSRFIPVTSQKSNCSQFQ